MDYAVVLYFDKETETYFHDIIVSIAESGASNYMIDNKVIPHITIADFHTENIDNVINALEKGISDFKQGDVIWASLSSFVPRVLFAAPVMNEYLLNACVAINRIIKPLAPHCGNGQYLPFQWVPHTTLASRLDSESLSMAFNIASQRFSAIKGQCNKISLIQCSPVQEIKTWDLIPSTLAVLSS